MRGFLLHTFLFCQAFVPGLLSAQDSAALVDSLELKEVEISGTRLALPLSEVPRKIQKIEITSIESQGASDLTDLLEARSDVDVRQRSPWGAQADLSIRGGSFEQALVMIDGFRLNDAQTGHHHLNVPLETVFLDRVEVLSGGGSRTLGPYAFSGAVNFVTRTPQKPLLNVQLNGGSFGLLNVSAVAGNGNEKASWLLGAAHTQTDGFTENTDLRMQNILAKGTYSLSQNHKISLLAGINNKGFGALNFYSFAFPLQYEATRAAFAGLQGNVDKGKLMLNYRLYARQHNDRFELYRETGGYYARQGEFLIYDGDTAAAFYRQPNFHRGRMAAADINLAYQWLAGITSLGVETRYDQILSNNLGEPLGNPVSVSNEEATYTRFAQRRNAAFFAEHQVSAGNLRATAGLLANFNSEYEPALLPGADLSYRLSKWLRIKASASQSYRIPSYTDLYYNLGGAQGSINLKPESAINADLGLRVQRASFTTELTAYRRWATNLIDWVNPDGTDLLLASNLTEAEFTGIEGLVEANEEWLLDKTGILQRLSLGAFYQVADTVSQGFSSTYTLDFVRLKIYGSAHLKLHSQFTLVVNARYFEREGEYPLPGADNLISYKPVTLVDCGFYFRSGKLGLNAKASNVLNTPFTDLGGIQLPGRWLSAGISFTM